MWHEVDARIVVHHVTNVDPHPILHAVLFFDFGIAPRHCLLNGAGAFHGVYHTGEFGKDAIASSIDDPSAETRDHGQDHCLMGFDITNSACLVVAHQGAVSGYVSSQYCCEPTLLALSHRSGS